MKPELRRGENLGWFVITSLFLLFFVFFQSNSIYGGDAGDLASAAYLRGVAHPPGYPLYTFFGWLLTRFPWQTVAWRVGFLSSIPAALTLGFFYLLLKRLTKSLAVAVIATLALGFTYLFWLYSIVVEVFALHLLFVVSILYWLIVYRQTQQNKYLFIAALLFSLSLTHHQTILLLLPLFVWLVFPGRKKLLKDKSQLFILVGLVLIGLFPYVYVVWAAKHMPLVNWENPQTVTGFIRLVTRALYGTFRSGKHFSGSANIGVQIRVFLDTLLIDTTKLGLVLAIIGWIYTWFKNRLSFWIGTLGFLFTGPLFIIYAGFPLIGNFFLGTVERFLLTPYLFLFIFISFGIKFLSVLFQALIDKLLRRVSYLPVVMLFGLYPIALLVTNYPKLAPLKNDFTAENMGRDILASVPDKAMLFIVEDTTLFDTQYVYFSSGGEIANKGIKLFQIGLLSFPYYRQMIEYNYPDLEMPDLSDPAEIVYQLSEKYYYQYPIFISMKISLPSDMYVWLPYGLLFKLHKVSEPISVEDTIAQQKQLFAQLHSPIDGVLSVYNHVMLADVRRVYGNGHREFADVLFRAGEVAEARKYYELAWYYQPDEVVNGLKLASVLIQQKNCHEAEELLTDLSQRFPTDSKTTQLLFEVYKYCFKDEIKAVEIEKQIKHQEVEDVLLKDF